MIQVPLLIVGSSSSASIGAGMGSGSELARVVVAGGDGAVGRLLAAALAEAGAELTLCDLAPAPRADVAALGRHVQLDARRPSPDLRALLAGADCAILALPEAAALEALPHVLAALPPGALLADTLSVKTPFASAALAAGAPVELLGLNPMFAPSLGWDGQAVLAVELAPGPRAAALLALLRERARVVTVPDAAAHDRLTAALQVLPHAALIAVGLALAEQDADLGALLEVAPPPFRALLALLARIADGSPETYADVQRANPEAPAARAALAAALARLDGAAGDEDPARVAALLGALRAWLGARREPLAAQAADLLGRLADRR
jgi:4-amino-4-deoxyprephenate dehydrogenase